MADYRKRSKPQQLPQNGSQDGSQNSNVDLNALADLIANKVSQGIEIPQNNGIIHRDSAKEENAFDDSSSMDALAKTMVVQRGDKSSNFENLGGINKTKKDNDKTNSTIDLLSDLED